MAVMTASYPERHPDEINLVARMCLNDSSKNSLRSQILLAAYFISNNLWGDFQIENFLERLIIQQQGRDLLMDCLRIGNSTTKAFAEGLLRSPVIIRDLDLLRALLNTGDKREILSGSNGSKILDGIIFYIMAGDDTRHFSENVHFLLKEGLFDSKILSCRELWGNLLGMAVFSGDISLLKTLIEARLDLNSHKHDIDSWNYPLVRELCHGIERWNSPLAFAVWNEDLEAVKILVEADANVDESQVDSKSVLDWTWKKKQHELHTTLREASTQRYFPFSLESICQAADRGPSAVGKLFTDVDMYDSAGLCFETALVHAIQKGETTQVKSLLAVGIDPKFDMAIDWEEPFVEAVGKWNMPFMEALLDTGAEVGSRVIETAISHSKADTLMLRLLLERASRDYNIKGRFGTFALIIAADRAVIAAVRLLLDLGVDINAPATRLTWDDLLYVPPASSSLTALQAAANDVNLIRYLISRGADVNKYSGGQPFQTALQVAVNLRNRDSVKELLKSGARVNTSTFRDGTLKAIQIAARAQDVYMVQLLIAEGADVNATGKHVDLEYFQGLRESWPYWCSNPCQSALQNAMRGGNLTVTQALLDAKANVNVMCSRSTCETVLQTAVQSRQLKLVQVILNAGAEVNSEPRGHPPRSPIQQAAEQGDTDVVALLLQAGADVNCPPGVEFGRTALQAASSSEVPYMDLIERLLAAGAEVNAPAGLGGGVTALQGAAIRGRINVAARLIQHGALVNAPAALMEGRTAIEGAAEHGCLDMVQLLLDAGATSDPSEAPFERAIEFAEREGHFEVAKLLRRQAPVP